MWDHFLGRGRAVELLVWALFYSKSLAVSSYDPAQYYIQGILRRLATVLTLGKTTQFFIPDPPTGVELEQLTETAPHVYTLNAHGWRH